MFATVIAMTLLGCLPGKPMMIAEDVTHVKIYYEAGRFGGWPANHGIWCWGNEILVGYSRGYYQTWARHATTSTVKSQRNSGSRAAWTVA